MSMFKINTMDLVIQLGIVGAVGYFAITYGPMLMDTVAQSINNAIGGGQAMASGAGVPSCAGITDPTQLAQCQQALTSGTAGAQCQGITDPMQLQLCQYMSQMQGGLQGAGGLGPLNQGLPSPFGSALQNTGGIPGQIPGVFGGTNPQYPNYTGATQFLATPLGQPNIACPNGVCRAYTFTKLNGGGF